MRKESHMRERRSHEIEEIPRGRGGHIREKRSNEGEEVRHGRGGQTWERRSARVRRSDER